MMPNRRRGRRYAAGGFRVGWPAAVCVGLAALTLFLPSSPTYDPWAWLMWGREIAAGDLSTSAGPAFKPLPVALGVALAPAGSVASDLWLVLARAGALLALAAAFALARRLAGGSVLAGVAAAAGVALCQGWLWHGALGQAEGILVALALVAFDRALAGHPRQALLMAFGAALVRPEVWPFAGAYGVYAWVRHPHLRPAAFVLGALVPALWLGPELVGSGQLWRSAARARVPNEGAPVLSAVPALESARRAATIPLAPMALAAGVLGAACLRRRPNGRRPVLAALPAAAGVTWIALVAAMSQAGFSGEERYLLPGAALVSVSGGAAIGLGVDAVRSWRRRTGGPPAVTPLRVAVLMGLAAGTLPFVAARVSAMPAEGTRLAFEARLFDDLREAIRRAGGTAAVRRCGRPFAGSYRAPALAWHLGVHKDRIGLAPRAPGVVFRSRLTPTAAVAPQIQPREPFRAVVRSRRWEVLAACARGRRLHAVP